MSENPTITAQLGDAPRPTAACLLRFAHILPELLSRLQPRLRALDRQLAERHGLTESQWSGLEVLERDGPQTVTGLGEALGLEKSTASRLADGLIAGGLARKRPSLTDGRSVVLQLTDGGLRKVRAMLNDRTEVWMGVVARWSEGGGRDDLPRLLHDLTNALKLTPALLRPGMASHRTVTPRPATPGDPPGPPA